MDQFSRLRTALLLIGKAVINKRFDLTNEKTVQDQIEQNFIAVHVPFERERLLSASERPDFWVDNLIAVEVKIKHSKLEIYRQMERYAQLEAVKMIVLVTSKAMGLPKTINDKPVHYISISSAWL